MKNVWVFVVMLGVLGCAHEPKDVYLAYGAPNEEIAMGTLEIKLVEPVKIVGIWVDDKRLCEDVHSAHATVLNLPVGTHHVEICVSGGMGTTPRTIRYYIEIETNKTTTVTLTSSDTSFPSIWGAVALSIGVGVLISVLVN